MRRVQRSVASVSSFRRGLDCVCCAGHNTPAKPLVGGADEVSGCEHIRTDRQGQAKRVLHIALATVTRSNVRRLSCGLQAGTPADLCKAKSGQGLLDGKGARFTLRLEGRAS